jgi:hypothetical protein
LHQINQNEKLKIYKNNSLNYVKNLSNSLKNSVSGGSDSSMQVVFSDKDESIIGKELGYL